MHDEIFEKMKIEFCSIKYTKKITNYQMNTLYIVIDRVLTIKQIIC